MKIRLFKVLTALMLFLIPIINYGQAPTLGTVANFVLFTTNGAMTNAGIPHLTHLTGNVGSNLAGAISGFGNVDGQMHDFDPATAACVIDLTSLYNQLNLTTSTFFPVSPLLGNGDTLVAGVYQYPLLTATSLNLNLILDAQGNSNAVFIIKIDGALSVNALAKVVLANGALACNVFWKVEGLMSMAPGATMRGNIVVHNAAISMSTLDTLEGRALSINGAVTLSEILAYMPIGCGSAILTGPAAPALGAAGPFAVFTSIGACTSTPLTFVKGDVGSNSTTTTGFVALDVTGTIHTPPDAATAAAAGSLLLAYNYLNTMAADIDLLDPANFGYNLVLTPHTYLLGAMTLLTDTVILNAEGDANAVFIIQINGAFNTTTFSDIKLINGTQAKNVYWLVNGAVHIYDNSYFNGQIIAAGAITLNTGDTMQGRALTINGAIAINGSFINSVPQLLNITGDTTVCVGSSITLNNVDTGGVWSSSNSHATVSNGIVTGVTAGIDTITYRLITGIDTAKSTHIVTVMPLPNAGSITGGSSACIGSTLVLTDITTGGTWSSSNLHATVINGTVTPVSAGIDTIKYRISNSCGSDTAIKIITIGTAPVVGFITGSSTVCMGSKLVLTDVTIGGTWSSSNLHATVLNGTVTPVSVGNDTIRYIVSSACGIDTVLKPITINALPNAGSITGGASACIGFPLVLTDVTAGGTWSSSNLHATVLNGTVTPVSAGIDTIRYMVTTACGTDTATKIISIGTSAFAGTITGGANVCMGSKLVLTDITIGGTWSSSNIHATVLNGTVTPVSAGLDTIRYIVTNACGTDTAIKAITITNLPNAGSITGGASACIGFPLVLTDITPGGVWSSSNLHATVINGTVTPVSSGIDTIRYMVTNACGTDTATKIIGIGLTAFAGTITGSSSVCMGSKLILTDATVGGTWSSSNIHATVLNGTVTPVTVGLDTIKYIVINACGSDTAFQTITINALPNAGNITGGASACIGFPLVLTDVTSGGAWSSSNTNATVISGTVTPVSAGIDTIMYMVTNVCGTDTATKAIAIGTSAFAGAISGGTSVCMGSALILTDGTFGGAWSSSNVNASVFNGTVTPVAAGLDTIRYIVSNTCGTDTAFQAITINALPNAGVISGFSTFCYSSAIALTTTGDTSGVWIATNLNAIVTAYGAVAGINNGLDTILYIVSNSCGNDTASKYETIDSLPHAGTITGGITVCLGATLVLTDTTTGGIWASSNVRATVLNGTVTPVSIGIDTIRYMFTNTCGTDTATKRITINTLPSAGTITGGSTVCMGSNLLLADATGGGSWSSSNADATVLTGIVAPVAAGLDTIRYIVISGCGRDTAIKPITINALPNAGSITGGTGVCMGATLILSDIITGGTWSSSNISATVTSGTVTPVSAGIDTIRYMVTNSCGTDTANNMVTITALPVAGIISGFSNVCIGASITLTDTLSSGVWSVSNRLDTVFPILIGGFPVGGVVIGLTAGTDTIIYTASNICGSDTTTKTIITNPLPFAGTITDSMTGSNNVCMGSDLILIETVTGGVWSSSNAHATLSADTLTPVSTGIDTIMYMVTNICGTDTAKLAITINALPILTSSATPTAICDSTLFSYIPTASVSGSLFTWSRAFEAGISNPADTGSFSIADTLYNITDSSMKVTYVYTITASGCMTSQNVTVTVQPTPKLDVLTDAACNNLQFVFTPTSLTSGATYAWTQVVEAGVTGGTLSGTNAIISTLTNSLATQVNVVYVYTVTANACSFVQDVVVILYPSITAPVIATQAPNTACMGTMYQNYGAATEPPVNIQYNWSTVNAIVWAQGLFHQYSLISFPETGTATITLTASITGSTCNSQASTIVTVGTTTAQTPVVSYFNGHFVCTPNDEGSYQWGYDDAITLDSTILTGEINQDYINAAPDAGKYYWAMTTSGGCLQKSYFTTALTVQNVNNDATVSVYPNPANGMVNIAVSKSVTGKLQVEVLNMVGQKIASVQMIDNKAAIDIAALPDGIYLVNCYMDGIKISESKFIKN